MKNIYDCHVHSFFSPDSELSMAEAILKALDKGLGGLAFTDHVDLNYPYIEEYPLIDEDKRFREIRNLQRKVYPKLKILYGVELGLQHDNLTENKKYLQDKNFDFIIGSIHAAEGIALAEDNFFREKPVKEYLIRFFEYTLKVITEFEDFDVLGHLDIIRRYSPEKIDLKPEDFGDLIDKILKTLIEKGRGIELNTSGLRYGLGSYHPLFWIIKRYRELGGEIITLGSDAHRSEDIGFDFPSAVELLLQAGFKYLTLFKKRQPQFVPLCQVV